MRTGNAARRQYETAQQLIKCVTSELSKDEFNKPLAYLPN